MRIGIPSYSNAYPLTLSLQKYSPYFSTPSHLNTLFAEGALDLMISSSSEAGRYPYLEPFCVAASGKIQSVLLYTKVEPTKIKTLAFDPASATTTALVKILCQHHWKISPQIVDNQPDAFFRIGDPALQNPCIQGFMTIDLAAAWYEMTKLPFVFSLIFYKPSLSEELLRSLISSSLTHFHAHRRSCLQEASLIYKLPLSLLDDYYPLCQYTLGPKGKEALLLFLKLQGELV